MKHSARISAFLCLSAGLARSATAQAGPQVRFTTVDSTGNREWTGRLEWVTPDSLHVLVHDADTVVVGEVGLGGEVRQARQVTRRLSEALRLGFGRAIVCRCLVG